MKTVLLITDFGAVADGRTANTKAVNSAIEAAGAAGGGKVVVPPGEFLSGTVILKSNVTLELMTGAVLKASPEKSEYPDFPPRDYHPPHLHRESEFYRYFIFAEGCEHITICGGGTIDGNVAAFTPGWNTKKPFTWTSPSERLFTPMIEIADCRDVRIHDVTITNAPGWDCHLAVCDRVWIEGVHLINYLYAGNSDGFDIDGCHDVMISNCRIETGDDCIVLKSFPKTRSCERITITNCILKTMCAALKIGTETWHDFRRITFSNSVVYESSRAFQITSFDGGSIEDIAVANITVDTNSGNGFNRPIMIDLGPRPKGILPGITPETQPAPGSVCRISISNIVMETDGRILLNAMDGRMLEDITLRDITVKMPWIDDPEKLPQEADPLQGCASGPEVRHARAVVAAKNVEGLRVEGFTVRWPDGPPPADFKPKRKQGEIVRDPFTEPLPPFAPFYGKGLRKGSIDLSRAEPFGGEKEKAVLNDCDLEQGVHT